MYHNHKRRKFLDDLFILCPTRTEKCRWFTIGAHKGNNQSPEYSTNRRLKAMSPHCCMSSAATRYSFTSIKVSGDCPFEEGCNSSDTFRRSILCFNWSMRPRTEGRVFLLSGRRKKRPRASIQGRKSW